MGCQIYHTLYCDNPLYGVPNLPLPGKGQTPKFSPSNHKLVTKERRQNSQQLAGAKMLQHSTVMYSVSYIIWLQPAFEYGGCSEIILTSPLKLTQPSKGISYPDGDLCRRFTKQTLPAAYILHSNPIPSTDGTNGFL